jgi:uncharacterized protein (DUF486 family)
VFVIPENGSTVFAIPSILYLRENIAWEDLGRYGRNAVPSILYLRENLTWEDIGRYGRNIFLGKVFGSSPFHRRRRIYTNL